MVVAQDDRGGSSSDSSQLFGKVPDVATRLTERSDADSVVISEATYRLVKDRFSCLEMGPGQAEGSVPLYQVLPLTYGQMPLLVKPWVTRFPLGASYLRHLKDVVIERDCRPQ